jgi:Zeta toxin
MAELSVKGNIPIGEAPMAAAKPANAETSVLDLPRREWDTVADGVSQGWGRVKTSMRQNNRALHAAVGDNGAAWGANAYLTFHTGLAEAAGDGVGLMADLAGRELTDIFNRRAVEAGAQLRDYMTQHPGGIAEAVKNAVVSYFNDKAGAAGEIARAGMNGDFEPAGHAVGAGLITVGLTVVAPEARLAEGAGALARRAAAPRNPGAVAINSFDETALAGAGKGPPASGLSKPATIRRSSRLPRASRPPGDRPDTLRLGSIAQDSAATKLAGKFGLPAGEQLPPEQRWSMSRTIDPETGERAIFIYTRPTKDADALYRHELSYIVNKARSMIEPAGDGISLEQARLYADRTRDLNAGYHPNSVQAFLNETPVIEDEWEAAAISDNWLVARQRLQTQMADRFVNNAIAQARHQAGDPTVYAMRGNTASGKSMTARNIDELAHVPFINPDNFKHQLLVNTRGQLTHYQVHLEGTTLADKVRDKLLDPATGVRSFGVDMRFGTLEVIKGLAEQAQAAGRKFNMYDIDAPAEMSLVGILMRRPGGADPIVPFDVVGENGFVPARKNREAVMKYFEANPNLGKYELFATRVSGEKYPVARVENGKTEIFDQGALRSLRDGIDAERQINKLRNTVISDSEIDRVTGALPDGKWKQSIIETLNQYEGLSWEEAINKHSSK